MQYSDQFFSAIVENSTELITIINEKGVLKYISPSVEKILGYSPSELRNTPILNFIHPDDAKIAQKAFSYVNKHKKVKLPLIRYKDKIGNYRWIDCITSNMVSNPVIKGFITNSRDVTDRILAEKERKESQAYYTSLFHDHPDLVFTLNTDGLITNSNKQVQLKLGYLEEELHLSSFLEIVYSPDLKFTSGAFKKAISGKAHHTEVRVKRKDKGILCLQLTIIPVSINNILQCVQVIGQDISEKKNAELNLRSLSMNLSQQNQDLQQFSYMVSHNLRAPLASAKGILNALKIVEPNDPFGKQAIELLEISLENLDNVIIDINNILSVKDNQGASDDESCNLLNLVTEAVLSLSDQVEDAKGDMILSVDTHINIKTRRVYLYSIIFNLISNALKYKSAERVLKVKVSAVQSKTEITFSVSDNGIGMDLNKHKNQLFKRYKRFHLSKEGKGIGLYLVKTQVEALGGTIEVESTLGLGTSFIVKLPVKI